MGRSALICATKSKREDFMTRLALLISTILVLPLLVPQGAQSAASLRVDPASVAGAASEEALSAFAMRRGGGGARAANVSRGHVGHRTANVNHNINRNLNRNVNRNANVDRNVNINRNIARVGVGGVGGVGVVRPVRPRVRRPYYGTVIAGITLGTIIAATAVPAAPGPDLCWYWSNSSQTRGYWDYCK
jgi:hypothetical protein